MVTNETITFFLGTLAGDFEMVEFNNNKKFRSFKSKENIHKKEVGPYRGFRLLKPHQ